MINAHLSPEDYDDFYRDNDCPICEEYEQEECDHDQASIDAWIKEDEDDAEVEQRLHEIDREANIWPLTDEY